MRLPMRDIVATALVAAAGLVYALWVFDLAPWGMSSVRMTGLAILTLGFLASASAVVPGFERLMGGNRLYLAATTAMGFAAFAGGLWMLIASAEPGLSLLIGALGALWLVSTVHHAMLAGGAAEPAGRAELRSVERREAA